MSKSHRLIAVAFKLGNSMSTKIIIATRESRLALWQAHFVKSELERHHPELTVELLGMTTRGDQILDQSLSKIGGKGLFVKELETALADGRADIAVHSLKDVPMVLPDGFALPCVMAREDARDAFISNDYDSLEDLPEGAMVGTSSLRRSAQIQSRFSHIRIEPLRGNLDTRLRKLDEGQYHAIILAAAGVKRLGLSDRVRSLLPTEVSLPAAGQGALGIEIAAHRNDLLPLLAPLHDAITFACTAAERAVSRALGGSCQVPLAAYAIVHGEALELTASMALPDGSKHIQVQVSGVIHEPEALGLQAVQLMQAQGVQALIDALPQYA